MEQPASSSRESSTVAREPDAFDLADRNEATNEAILDGQAFDYSLSAMDRQYATQTSVPRRIHILGTGNIGKLVAHSIRGLPNPPPVTLLLNHTRFMNAWEKSTKEITIVDDGKEIKRSGFEAELMPRARKQHGVKIKDGDPNFHEIEGMRPDQAASLYQELQDSHEEFYDSGEVETIDNLIITTKAPFTLSALADIKHRLEPTSTICFMQNGMGVIDEINEKLFPDEATRPNYMQGIITHGVNSPPELLARNPFLAVHAGHGTISLSLIASSKEKGASTDPTRGTGDAHDTQSQLWADSSRYLLRTLTRSPVLCAVGFSPIELFQLQLEKLAVNSILNPLTALLDVRNGDILYNNGVNRTMRLLLAETSLVIRSLPELQNIPNVATRFSSQRLETLVVNVAHTTRDNISSMLSDVRSGRTTEIKYINGYIVKRGEELGIKCVTNYSTMQMVLGKSAITRREKTGEAMARRIPKSS